MQLVANSTSELGVQSQYFDGELHLVDDTLAGRLSFRPQLKILRIVVQSVSVLVVDIFSIVKRSSENLGHHKTMLKDFTATAQVDAAVSARVDVAVFVNRSPSASLVTAFTAAKSLLFVVARMLAVFGLAQLALASLSTKFTLKRRWELLVHKEQLQLFAFAVKENL
jgi:hypothetical protein